MATARSEELSPMQQRIVEYLGGVNGWSTRQEMYEYVGTTKGYSNALGAPTGKDHSSSLEARELVERKKDSYPFQYRLTATGRGIFATGFKASDPPEATSPFPRFEAGASYTRSQVLGILRLPDPGGGAWYTGLVRHEDEHFIFCGVGVAGRTGHDYENRFVGPDLVWHGRTGARLSSPSIQELLSGGRVHVFFRDDERAPFTYAGVGLPSGVVNAVPVQIRWSFRRDDGAHPEYLPEEVDDSVRVVEGAKRTVVVNVYERDPSARAHCIRRWGTKCVVCSFDFAEEFGALGKGYIHVHHMRPLNEIGEEYVLNPTEDLRPVCPNCHAMLHRTSPAMTIEQLMSERKSAMKDRMDAAP